MDAEPIEKIDQVRGKTDANGHVADGIFEDEVPTDDPGDKFAHGGVGVGVGAAGDGDHGGELGVADRSEAADDGNQYERDRDCGAGTGTAEGRGMMDQLFEKGSIQDRFSLQGLPCDGGADYSENSGAYDGANAEGGKAEPAERFLEADFGVFGIGEELVDTLAVEELGCHSLVSDRTRKIARSTLPDTGFVNDGVLNLP